MDAVQQLVASLPDTAKDLRLNLAALLAVLQWVEGRYTVGPVAQYAIAFFLTGVLLAVFAVAIPTATAT